jgi:hypothetical protein
VQLVLIRSAPLALLSVMLGCTGGLSAIGEGDADTDADGDADADTELDPEQSAAEQLDLHANPNCDHFTDTDGTEYDVPGATSYFAGQYTISGDSVRGWEWQILFANDSWKETSGAADCQIAWFVSGSVVAAGSECPDCDFGIDADARMDMSETNCLEEYVDSVREDADSMHLQYDVNTLGSHNATFYFAGSGNELANGPVDGDVYTWVTDSACKWF